MTLFVKNMVCARCERTVGRMLAAAGLQVRHLRLGEVDIEGDPAPEQWEAIRRALYEEGFELLEDRASRLIEQIRTIVINEIHHETQKPETMNFSDLQIT